MAITYSSTDTVQEYRLIFGELKLKEVEYDLLNLKRKFINFSAGLGISNSVHEKFVKSIFAEYRTVHVMSNRQYQSYLKKYKGPQKIGDLANVLHLDLNEGFNLNKVKIHRDYPYIVDVNNLLTIITNQRGVRNDYLHGDFDLTSEIIFSNYFENIMKMHDLHSFMFDIFLYSFKKDLASLPALPRI